MEPALPEVRSARAVDGVATVEGEFRGIITFTVVPISASGTGTVTAKMRRAPNIDVGYETAYNEDGDAMTLDLSAQVSKIYKGNLSGIKVSSDSSSDTFDLLVSWDN